MVTKAPLQRGTRKENMAELNKMLNLEYNWSRINALDLQRLVDGVKNALNGCDRR